MDRPIPTSRDLLLRIYRHLCGFEKAKRELQQHLEDSGGIHQDLTAFEFSGKGTNTDNPR